MTLLGACEWLENSAVGTTMRNSKWGFALVEMVHLLALALLGGTLFASALQAFGIILRGSPPGATARDLKWAQLGSLAAMILSGILLFSDGPLRYYANAAFRLKLLFIAAALVMSLVAHLIGAGGSLQLPTPTAMRAATLLSLVLWLGAGIAGRVIGVL
jgi:hypothetical protein